MAGLTRYENTAGSPLVSSPGAEWGKGMRVGRLLQFKLVCSSRLPRKAVCFQLAVPDPRTEDSTHNQGCQVQGEDRPLTSAQARRTIAAADRPASKGKTDARYATAICLHSKWPLIISQIALKESR
jgi:hypothetical protein